VNDLIDTRADLGTPGRRVDATPVNFVVIHAEPEKTRSFEALLRRR